MEKALAALADAVKRKIGTPDYALGVFLRGLDRLSLWHDDGRLKMPGKRRGKHIQWLQKLIWTC